MNTKQKVGVLILAAGNSSRLGEPKQLLLFNNKTLIRNVVDAALNTIPAPVTIVTGAYSDQISQELTAVLVNVIHNPLWEEGMASSIRLGVSHLLSHTASLTGIIVCVSDQPFINAALFQSIIDKANAAPHKIVASQYENILGTPVLFAQKHFEALLALKGAEGAKKILHQFPEDVVSVPFPMGGIDIDTQENYQKLTNI